MNKKQSPRIFRRVKGLENIREKQRNLSGIRASDCIHLVFGAILILPFFDEISTLLKGRLGELQNRCLGGLWSRGTMILKFTLILSRLKYVHWSTTVNRRGMCREKSWKKLRCRLKVEEIHPHNPPKLRGCDVDATWLFPWGGGGLSTWSGRRKFSEI